MSRRKALRERRTRLQKFGSAIIAAVLVMAMVIGLMPNETTSVLAAEKTSDLETTTKYTESLGDNASTEYAGRIWTDKTVFTSDATFAGFEGSSQTVENDSDFLISFSALATAQSISGQTQAPIDVVFVIDLSGSMSNADSGMDNGYSRIYNAVQALNESIETLMDMNEHTRVGVVGFNRGAVTLLPLDHYTKSGNNAYFSLNRNTASSNNATLYTRAVGSSGNTITEETGVQNGTNIQAGLYEGMNLLASAASTTATIDGKEIKRIPSVILLSDGAPTFSSESESWWAPSTSANSRQGDGSDPYYGNGMLAMMTAAYMKEAIDRHYEVSGESATTVYTIGMGIDDMGTSDKNLANVVLNPIDYWDATNTYATNIRDAWDHYVNGEENRWGIDYTPNITVNSDASYTVEHPTTNDINQDNALKEYVDKYYSADDAASVTDVFADIVNSITINTPEVPTEHDSMDPLNSGYITYTDPIGEYMEVKDMKAIIYAGQKYTAHSVTTTDNVTTYAFTETAAGNDVYGPDQPLSEIVIEVETDTDANGIKTQVLTVKIPAALIPIRVNTVMLKSDGTVESHTNNGTYPIRVLYTVGMQDAVITQDGTVNMEVLTEEYIKENSNTDGTIDFYSNLYTGTNVVNGKTAGDATVEFTAASTNPFYYMQKDTILYTDEACTIPATGNALVADQNYYYKEVFYHGLVVEEELVVRTGAQLSGNTIILQNANGEWYRPAGTVRLNRMLEFEGTKTANATETAEDFYAPTYDAAAMLFKVYHGNNGVMSVTASGSLEISKNVTAADGLTAPEREFVFTVNLTDASNNTLSERYDYIVTDAAGAEVRTGTVVSGETIRLTAGQTATIINLPPATKYTVTETAVAGFATSVAGETTNTVSGTITAGATAAANFVNHYSVEEITVTDMGFSAEKTLNGREWSDADAFTFILTADNAANPLPEQTTVTVTEADLQNGVAVFTFGDVVYEHPGTYTYTIIEEVHELAGMTYSAALYDVVVTVTDNGDGTLSADTELYQILDDVGQDLVTEAQPDGVLVEDNVAKFVNTYRADATSYGQVVQKVYTDHSGQKGLVDGMFRFKLEAVDNAPMPESAVNGVMYASNVGAEAIFPQITYTQAMAGNTYEYKISEVIPEGAAANEDGTYTYNGMTYDGSVHITTIKVSLDPTDDKVVLEVRYDDELAWYTSFTNEYNETPVTLEETPEGDTRIKGTKTLTGRDMKADEVFNFTLTAANEATSQAVTDGVVVYAEGATDATVSGAQDGAVTAFTFGEITFTKQGTYTFNVQETPGNAGGVTYDTHVCTVTVVVTDSDDDSILEAAVTYSDGADGAVFNNTYDAVFDDNTAISLSGTKQFTGRPLNDGEFYFVVEGQNDAPLGRATAYHPVAGDSEADENGVYEGAISFLEDVTYTEAGEYVYLIREYIPATGLGGVTYDTTVYRVTVTVTDDLNGNLTAAITKMERSEDGSVYVAIDAATPIVFANTYDAKDVALTPYEITKVLAGKRNTGLQEGEFEFEISIVSENPVGGMILPNPAIVANDANGKVQFGDITFTEAGTYVIEIKEVIPEGAVPNEDGTYTLNGITYDTHSVRSTFQVVDDLDGNLVVTRTGSTGSTTFTNTYEGTGTLVGETNLMVEKILEEREWQDTDVFTFVLAAQDDATRAAIESGKVVLPGNATGINAVKDKKEVAFGDIIFYEAGTYNFLIWEDVSGELIPGVDYDTSSRTVTVTATDNGDGTLTVMAEGSENLTFINTYVPEEVLLYGHGNLDVTKNFTGRENDEWLDIDSFVFNLAIDQTHQETVDAFNDGKIVMSSTSLTVTKDNKDHAHFGNITFKQTGTYQFVVSEVQGTMRSVKYDETTKTVIVNVTDNGDGTMNAVLAGNSEDLTFTNTYSTVPVSLEGATNLEVTKEISGRDWFAEDEFTFTLEPADQVTKDAVNGVEATEGAEAILPTITLPENAAGIKITGSSDVKEAAFGDIKFTEPGVYSFLIKEAVGNIANMSYDRHSVTVSVTVEDNLEGALEITNVTTSGSMTWTNVYTPDAIAVTVEVEKAISGRDMTANDIFNFTIIPAYATPNAPMPEVTRVQNTAPEGLIVFGPITYTSAGTYQYVIYEDIVNANGITSDTGNVLVTVEVQYNSKTGTFVPFVSYDKRDEFNISDGTIYPVFVNKYNTTGTLEGKTNLVVTKNFTGRVNDAWLETDKFVFTLAVDPEHADTVNALDSGYITMPNTTLEVTRDNKDEAYFGDIVFTQEGTYQFVVTEEEGDIDGVTYDSFKKVVVVNVVDDGDGIMEVTLADGSQALEFTNTYSTTDATLEGARNLDVTKELSGRNWFANDEFTFTLVTGDDATAQAVADGIVILPNTEISISGADEEKSAHFGDIKFKEIGEYTFVISETKGTIDNVTYDEHTTTVVVTVADSTKGYLEVSNVVTTGEKSWNNTYTPDDIQVTLTGQKTIVGREWLETDQFTFTIAENGNAPLPEALSASTTDGTITFGPITYSEAGEYEYIIRETRDNKDGITCDEGYVIATVVITYNEATGEFENEVSYQKVNASGAETEDGFKFINSYSTTGTLEGATNLKVTKNFTGRVNDEWLDTDYFTFTLTVSDETTQQAITDGYIAMPEVTELVVTKENKNNAFFGDITFTKEGTYEFVVTEIDEDIRGVIYDTTPRVIKVLVADNLNGTMDVTVLEGSASLVFNNTYDTTETALNGAENLKVTKTLTGREWLASDVFTFELAAKDETVQAVADGMVVLPENAAGITISANAEVKEAAFGDIIFKETGVYKFTVTETKGNIAGVKYDESTKTVVVNVTDNTDGTMTATVVTDSSDALTFENRYTAEATTATIAGTKVMSGRDLKDTDIFQFTISAAEGTPMPAETTVSNDVTGTIEFAPITYTEAGTYTYTITETAGSAAGVEDTTEEITVTVTITDNKVGQLESAVAYSVSNANGFVYTNTYTTTQTDGVTIDAVKTVEATEGNSYTMKGGEFKFTITPGVGNPSSDPIEAATVTNAADGSVQFAGNVNYTEAGIYTYTIQEVGGTLGGMSYVSDVYVVTVTVTDNEDTAKLGAVTTITKNNETVDAITFDNGYDPAEVTTTIAGTKELTVTGNNDKTLEAGEFTFRLTAVDNAPMPEQATTTNTAAGVFQFGTITYTAPGTYQYQVSEVNSGERGYTYDASVYNVTITVEDVEGVLQVKENTSVTTPVVFENSYTPDSVTLQGETALKGLKTLNGRPLNAGEFVFQLIDADNEVVLETTNNANGSFAFEPLTFTEEGTYYYTIAEKSTALGGVTYDTNTYTVKIVVDDMGGYLTADVEYLSGSETADVVFENTYKAASTSVTLNALKRFAGHDLEAGEFTFVLKDEAGEVVATATNDANGMVLFETLEYTEAGTYVYTVTEELGEAEYIVYDENVYYVTVEVTDNLKGNLEEVVTMTTSDGTKVTEIVFDNVYTPADAVVTLQGTKKLVGRDLEDGEFAFMLYNATDRFEVSGGVLQIVENTKDGRFTFDELVFTQPGTFYYVIVEDASAADKGITYDEAVYGVIINVTDNGEGALVAEILLQEDGKTAEAIEFVNVYEKVEEPGAPQTGDYNNIWMWMALLSGSIGVISTAVYSKKRK